MINCLLRDDGAPSYEDTCSFTCDTGYELTGSESRTCQVNGTWSGSIAMCIRGECNFLSNYIIAKPIIVANAWKLIFIKLANCGSMLIS